MANSMHSAKLLQPLAGLEAGLHRLTLCPQLQARTLTTSTFAYRPPVGRLRIALRRRNRDPDLPPSKPRPRPKVPQPILSIKKTCPEPIKAFNAGELQSLDPSGSRGRLISRTNPDALRVGDVALVRFKSGDPFAGLVLNIRRRGQDSGILLRNELTRVGTEMWIKLYSPTVAGLEIVQRSQKKMRRARAYYFRKPKHDRGSLANLVDNYTKETKRLGRSNSSGTESKGVASKRA